MTLVDAALAVLIALLMLSGFRRGLLVGVLSLAGLLAGAYVGARVVPDVLQVDRTTYLPLVTLGAAIVCAGLGQWSAVIVGRSLRTALRFGLLRAADNFGGAALGGATGLVLCWVLGAVFLYLPGQTELRRQAQDSLILSSLNDRFPPRDLIDALASVDPFATIAGPEAGVDRPDPLIARDPDVAAARRSIVRIRGNACGLGIEGSGWIGAPGLVVTNAHVVAGIARPIVDRGDGRTLGAFVAQFDARNDVAVLRVPGLTGAALPLAEPDSGVAVGILGYPENGPYTVTAGRIGRTVVTVGRDAYGRFPVGRNVTTLRAEIRPGNSGGPAVDEDGRVRTTVFAQRQGSEGGYGVPTSIVRAALRAAGTKPLETACVVD